MNRVDFSPRARQVIDITLSEVAHRYGDGINPGSIASCPYHNLEHSTAVMEGAVLLASRLHLSRAALELAALSGAAHDVIREHAEDMTPEEASAAWLRRVMLNNGYTIDDTTVTTRAILATTAQMLESGIVVQQTAGLNADSEANAVALCVASADLRALYMPTGPRAAHDYFRELRGLSGEEAPADLEGLRKYQLGEVALTSGYRYPLDVAEALFARDRDDIVAHHKRLIDLLDRGLISSWDDVVQLDLEYYEAHTQR